ncbi:NUDIX hydrolase [Cardinium endosymbiont of Culicoides punctatus]|uniref:NUDIX hydrolase n=1 Tax=Cardinium endosymbiont of Culicoides punctatus TaxID=2304601 RepID=UPI0010585179|nr:NUDIX hydrolase [Cardinium endosymbiont of Culicoides punctatus]TDG95282.1 Nucleoside triphosphatase NudI [Cardinium endosymbiont of Culicoides punctatus]
MALIFLEGCLMSFSDGLIEDFKPIYQIAVCYIVNKDGKVLLLKRDDSNLCGGKWCAPGGKLEKDETPIQTVIRETFEETAIQLNQAQLVFEQTVYMRLLQQETKQDAIDYILHLFKTIAFKDQPTITLNKEHTDYVWVNLQECNKLKVIPGGKELLQLCVSSTDTANLGKYLPLR